MPSYVIVGASRGLGYEWLRQLSSNPENTVIGLVRTPGSVETKLKADSISNVHVLKADMTDPTSLKAAAAETAKIVDSVDYLIVNGFYQMPEAVPLNPTDFYGKEDLLRKDMISSLEVNILGVIYSINAFLSLVRKSSVKKITVISSGMGDPDMMLKAGVSNTLTYGTIKAALNMVVVKYAAELKDEGITLLALSPGVVATQEAPPTEEQIAGFNKMAEQFRRVYPHFSQPMTPAESVKLQKQVIENVNLDRSGEFLSHLGTKQWL